VPLPTVSVPTPLPFQYIARSTMTFLPAALHVTSMLALPD